MAEIEKNTDNGGAASSKQILASTFILGGASVINIILGIVRTKILALLLGPAGVGLTGIYMSITNLGSVISGMGIGESGVRQIAGASGTGDNAAISRSIHTIRRAAFFSGVAGLFLLLLSRNRISLLTFGNSGHAFDLALLSVAVLFTAVSGAQTAVIQGMRRINDLAKISILGALWGTILSVPIIYLFGERGIVSSLLAVAAMAIFTSWWYIRKIDAPRVKVNWSDALSESKSLLKLGFAFMLGSSMIVGTQYLLRVIVVRYLGISAAGMYQAAANLSSVYVGIILKAMLTDFYPRLTAAVNDQNEFNALVNKQVEVGLLLAVPGILATMTLAPFVIKLFYSSKFMPALGVFRWQILGVLFQVVTWPLGFTLRAKGNGRLFFRTELFANVIHLSIAWLGIRFIGLSGVGMAFFGMNLFYGIMIYGIVRSYYKIAFSAKNVQILFFSALATGIAFLTPLLFSEMYLAINAGITVLVGSYFFKTLMDSTDMAPAILLKIRSRFIPD